MNSGLVQSVLFWVLTIPAEMQLNGVIKSIGWYWAFVALSIQTDTTKNTTDIYISILVSVSVHHYQFTLQIKLSIVSHTLLIYLAWLKC